MFSTSFSSSPSPLHPLVAAVDVEAVVAEEADEGDAEGGGEFDGEAGGSAHGADELDAGHGGFLEELEARASAEEQDAVVQWDVAGAQRVAEEFVERVVAADVFAVGEERAGSVEPAGGVDATGEAEGALGVA